MIHSKDELIKRLKKLSENKIDQGIEIRNLALSIESRRDERKLKEWVEFIQPLLNKLDYKEDK